MALDALLISWIFPFRWMMSEGFIHSRRSIELLLVFCVHSLNIFSSLTLKSRDRLQRWWGESWVWLADMRFANEEREREKNERFAKRQWDYVKWCCQSENIVAAENQKIMLVYLFSSPQWIHRLISLSSGLLVVRIRWKVQSPLNFQPIW